MCVAKVADSDMPTDFDWLGFCCTEPHYMGFNTQPGEFAVIVECLTCHKFYIKESFRNSPKEDLIGNPNFEWVGVCAPDPGESEWEPRWSRGGRVLGRLIPAEWEISFLGARSTEMVTLPDGYCPTFIDSTGLLPYTRDAEFQHFWASARNLSVRDTKFDHDRWIEMNSEYLGLGTSVMKAYDLPYHAWY